MYCTVSFYKNKETFQVDLIPTLSSLFQSFALLTYKHVAETWASQKTLEQIWIIWNSIEFRAISKYTHK